MTTNRPGAVWECARSSAWLRAILAYIGVPCLYTFVIVAAQKTTKSEAFFSGQTPVWVVIWGVVGGIALPVVVGVVCTSDIPFRRRYHRWIIGTLIALSAAVTGSVWFVIWLGVLDVAFTP